MTTAEWRWADVATGAVGLSEFAGWNPLRWSRSASIEATIQDLKGRDQGRPIILKVPAGVLSPERKFPNVPTAIDWLKIRAGVGVEWMWGDAPWMKWLPMKWSDTKGIEKTIADLREKERAEPNRPVLLKIPAGVLTPAKHHENIHAAIDHLDRALRHFSKWSVHQTFFLYDEIREPEDFLRLKDVPLLDKAIYTGVLSAVDRLNVSEGLCPDGICAVYSSRSGKYCILYTKQMQDEAERRFDLSTPFMKNVRSFLQNGAAPDFQFDEVIKFDNRKWIVSEKNAHEERYDVEDVIGKGVGGIVNLLKRKGTGQEYVMKKVSEVEAKREITALCNLRHPNCIKLVEYTARIESDDTADGGVAAMPTVCILCEYAPSGDLSFFIKQERQGGGRPTEMAIINIFKQVMLGLSYMHARRIVHNDIKGQNILVFKQDGDGFLKVALTDYGCARTIDDENPSVFGDPRYASPENLKALMDTLEGHNVSWRPDFESDVWSFGVTLYSESSNGLIPFIYEQRQSGTFNAEFPQNLRKAQMGATEVETAHCSEQLSDKGLSFLRLVLQREPDRRPTLRHLLNDPWVNATARNDRSSIRLSVHTDTTCQIIMNFVMWRLPFNEIKQCYELFKLFDTDHQGVINRDQFRDMFPGKPDRATRVFDLADINGDLTLEFNEFAAIAFNWAFMKEDVLDRYLLEVVRDLSEDCKDTLGIDDLSKHIGGYVKNDELESLVLRIGCDTERRFSAGAIRKFLQERQIWLEISTE